jgi:hypothetical protein
VCMFATLVRGCWITKCSHLPCLPPLLSNVSPFLSAGVGGRFPQTRRLDHPKREEEARHSIRSGDERVMTCNLRRIHQRAISKPHTTNTPLPNTSLHTPSPNTSTTTTKIDTNNATSGSKWRMVVAGMVVLQVCWVRCAFFDRDLHSRMPLDPTHVRLKRTCVWPMTFLSDVHFSYQFTL